MESVISAAGLVKRFGSFAALNGLDLDIRVGEVHGFLGPNGAGKTTTLRVLLGLLRADSGQVGLFGADPWKDAVELHRNLAYVPGDVILWPNLTGGEVIDLLGRLRGGYDPERRDELVERFQLDPTKKCKTYSKGNRQKVALISAFACDVPLYILDEPTSGLDPLMEQVFQACVREARGTETTVLLSSHILAQVEALCDRVSIIRQGQIIESGSLSGLRHLQWSTITAETETPPIGVDQLAGVHNLSVRGTKATLSVEAGALDEVIGHLHQFRVRSLTAAPPTLEELFLRHYDEEPGSRNRQQEKAKR
ncbi:ABC transporter ATP-binding protein [Brevibacterium picturae]|uniref:ABC transporter ATP-binding protein n=2 Tax=Brevibacterium picturae TaxID=260553 RepID=A0ABN2BZ96_9MICO